MLFSIVSVLILAECASSIPISASNKLFGHSIKNGPLAVYPAEQTTFEHICMTPPCTVTQVHIPSVYPRGSDKWDWESARLRMYIDNETVASIDLFLREVASVGILGATGDTAQDGTPFGHDLFGKTAKSGGVYMTVRIPFGTSLRTTITAPASYIHPSVFWFIIRGVEALPVALGGGELTLPDQARLVLYRNSGNFQPQDLITIGASPSGQAGALVNVFLDNNSTDYNFLEACVRFYANNASAPQFLSSGTEDFFNSASYFDESKFNNRQSGVTYLTSGPSTGLAMYKTHESRDFVLWNDGMLLQWKNMEESQGPGACPTTWPWPPAADVAAAAASVPSIGSAVGPLQTKTLVWMYVWPSNASLLTFSGKSL